MSQQLPPMLLHLLIHVNGKSSVELITRKSGLRVDETLAGLRELLAHYEESRDLVQVGAYRKGSDPLLDRAILAEGAQVYELPPTYCWCVGWCMPGRYGNLKPVIEANAS